MLTKCAKLLLTNSKKRIKIEYSFAKNRETKLGINIFLTFLVYNDWFKGNWK